MSIYTFAPIYQERIWGGRRLRRLYKRELPGTGPIGESWELADRPEANSVIVEGPKKGTLHDLWTSPERKTIFGSTAPDTERFPLLLKLLDCEDNLSVQVHPPAAQAQALHGEAKTEMWYFLHTSRKSKIYVGLKKGAPREAFEKAIGREPLAPFLHALHAQRSDTMFLPSGRVHAIGAGNMLFEVQQNSDTTYRVDDWGRVDSSGKPRELHVKEALQSINFRDLEPNFAQPHGERVLECPYFSVQRAFIFPDEYRCWMSDGKSFQYHFLARGELTVDKHKFCYGEGWLVTADHPSYELKPGGKGAELITVRLGIK